MAIAVAAGSACASDVDYVRDVKPLLQEKCGACHGPLAQKGGLRLDAGDLIRKGAESGPVIDVENPGESELLYRVTAEDSERMPPASEGERLTKVEVAVLRDWIQTGANSPADEEVLADPREHWAYQVPTRPAIPSVSRGVWSKNPIDAFVSQQHTQLGLVPVEPAGRESLLRRIYLDIVGLPPTAAELHAFLADPADDAYERVVDRLLDSPQYGERWGRHWMDVWRYSDWNGVRENLFSSQRHLWRWRDWIIESLNADKPYDQMILEMLAGDELAPDDENVLRATGYLARGYYRIRYAWLDGVVEHTAKGFLGITLNCARCHDHKYDPISQAEYYRFRAIFEPYDVRLDRLPGEPDVLKDGLPRVYDKHLDTPTYLFVRGDEKQPDKEHPLGPGLPEIFGNAELNASPVELPRRAWYPMIDDAFEREDLAAAELQAAKSQDDLERLQSSRAPPSDCRLITLKATADRTRLAALKARWVADKATYAETCNDAAPDELSRNASRFERQAAVAAAELAVFEKQQSVGQLPEIAAADANASKAEQELAAALKELEEARTRLAGDETTYTPVGTIYPRTSSGRRTALARWIASKQNPLTARVAVNHIWLRHFGTPLVDNVADFGLSAPRPPHADLLDWMAVQFMEGNWSMKRLHRLLVTSQTYRLASSTERTSAGNSEIDPENRFYWKYHAHRLEAEAVRDSLLAVAGRLDPVMGGADLDFADGESSGRRSVYFRTAVEKQMRLLVTFDGANPNECYRRTESILPQQALALANSPLVVRLARLLARELWSEVVRNDGSRAAFVQSAFERILSRAPTAFEEEQCSQFLAEQTVRLQDPAALTAVAGGTPIDVEADALPAGRARENLVQALFSHHDFVTVP